MFIELRNDQLTLKINSFGAEMKSLQKNSFEYLWQGSPDSWGGTSPQLFPIVGEMLEPGWLHKGQRMKMGNHGIARRSEFEIIEKGEDYAVFRLTDSEKSLKAYPFRFILEISYLLSGDSLKVSYRVKNPAEEELLFSLGAHPGFNCPLEEGLSFTDYYLQFNKTETIRRLLKEHYLTGKMEPSLNGQDRINLNHTLFDRGALIYRGLQSDSIILKSDKSGRSVKMDFEGFPYFGIWTIPEKNAPYICLEPWFGIDSTEGDSLDFSEKEGLITLGPEKEFNCHYVLHIT